MLFRISGKGEELVSQSNKPPSDFATILFVVVMCFVCALVLAVASSSLKERQEIGEKLEISKQMLMSAQIYHPNGYFQVVDSSGTHVSAKHIGDGILEESKEKVAANSEEIFEVFNRRIAPFLIDESGATSTFEEQSINEAQYVKDNHKFGYAHLPWKLAYKVFPNKKDAESAEAYLIPVSGMGLWAAIYGFIAVQNDGLHVLGISWYQHGETPGLGANISAPWWQAQFPGKQIFQAEPSGSTNMEIAPIGINVVRGKVKDVLGNVPKAKSSVDGMSGATLTGNGVAKAYKDSLGPYRAFLIQQNQENVTQKPAS